MSAGRDAVAATTSVPFGLDLRVQAIGQTTGETSGRLKCMSGRQFARTGKRQQK
jgi:hypothetical protein